MTNIILSALAERNERNWLAGADGQKISAIAQQKFQELTDSNQHRTLPKILLCAAETEQFIGQFMAAVAAGCPIFLSNPHWGKQEWQQVFDIVQPDIIWGNCLENHLRHLKQTGSTSENLAKNFAKNFANLEVIQETIQSAIMIPTGGSSGKIRFAIHTWETLTASVRGFTEYFQLSKVNSFCLLPLYHVSGLMQFLRSFISGGTLVIWPSYKAILEPNILEAIASKYSSKSEGEISGIKYMGEIEKIEKIEEIEEIEKIEEIEEIDPTTFFLSLVPTQLSRLLQNPIAAHWLSQFNTVLLGGAPAWPQLLEMAIQQQINLAPTYGMTETASQIVTLKPEEFLAGNNSSGRVLPHARVTICDEDGRQLGVNQIGMIKIRAKSLALGYYPPIKSEVKSLSKSGDNRADFISDDLGFFDADGYLNIVGRRSDKIITGGENVFPAEVEAAIRTTGLVTDVCAIALPDPDWGQAIAAVYVPRSSAVSVSSLTQALADRLAKFKQPKHWISVAQLPRNSQGKINRDRLYQIAAERKRQP